MPTVPIASIVRDASLQPRAHLSSEVIEDYAEAIKAGAEFPPVDIVETDEGLLLASGFHRVAAYEMAGISEVPADVVPGTRRDAMLHALAQNTSHGLRRTNEDKRRAVTMVLQDEEWSQWSDRKIAEHVGVSQPFVGEIRAQLITVISSNRRIGKDGKSRPAKNAKPNVIVNSGNRHDLGDDEQSAEDDWTPDVPTEIEADVPRTIKDGLGKPVPEKLRPAFECCVTFNELRTEMNRLVVAVKQLGGSPGGVHIFMRPIIAEIESAKKSLMQYLPYAPCAYCKTKGCDACKQSGFLPKQAYENAAKATK